VTGLRRRTGVTRVARSLEAEIRLHRGAGPLAREGRRFRSLRSGTWPGARAGRHRCSRRARPSSRRFHVRSDVALYSCLTRRTSPRRLPRKVRGLRSVTRAVSAPFSFTKCRPGRLEAAIENRARPPRTGGGRFWPSGCLPDRSDRCTPRLPRLPGNVGLPKRIQRARRPPR